MRADSNDRHFFLRASLVGVISVLCVSIPYAEEVSESSVHQIVHGHRSVDLLCAHSRLYSVIMYIVQDYLASKLILIPLT